MQNVLTETDLLTLPLNFEIDALHTAPGAELIHLRSGDTLRAVGLEALRSAARAQDPVDAPERSRGLTGDVVRAGDNFFVVRRGLERLPAGGGPAISVPLPELPGPLISATPDASGTQWLCVTIDPDDRGLSDFRITRTTPGGVLALPTLQSAIQPQVSWCGPAGGFLIFDALGERLWRLEQNERTPEPIDLQRVADRAIDAVCVEPAAGWLAIVSRSSRDGHASILHGGFSDGRLIWDTQPRIEDGLLQAFRWRPGIRELAVARVEKRRVDIEVIDSLGAMVGSCTLPRGWVVNDLAWAGDGRSLLIAAHDRIAIWTPPEPVRLGGAGR